MKKSMFVSLLAYGSIFGPAGVFMLGCILILSMAVAHDFRALVAG